MLSSRLHLRIEMLPQPNEITCGPTCLHAICRYWGRDEPLQNVIDRISKLEWGCTVAAFLGCDALRHGFQATIYTFNLNVFYPSWFIGKLDTGERLLLQRASNEDGILKDTLYLEIMSVFAQSMAECRRPLS